MFLFSFVFCLFSLVGINICCAGRRFLQYQRNWGRMACDYRVSSCLASLRMAPATHATRCIAASFALAKRVKESGQIRTIPPRSATFCHVSPAITDGVCVLVASFASRLLIRARPVTHAITRLIKLVKSVNAHS